VQTLEVQTRVKSSKERSRTPLAVMRTFRTNVLVVYVEVPLVFQCWECRLVSRADLLRGMVSGWLDPLTPKEESDSVDSLLLGSVGWLNVLILRVERSAVG